MKNKILYFLVCLSFLASGQVEVRTYYQDDKLTPREHNVDFQHLKLEISFEPENGKVIGEVTHRFKALQKEVDSIYLDAPDISIKKVMSVKEELKFKKKRKRTLRISKQYIVL